MVNRAKQTNTYIDRTHKLRSSIGCVLYHNDIEVFNYFESTGGEKGLEGVQDGLDYAKEIAELNACEGCIIGVVVAGAEYAVYVESYGYDVLTGSSHRFTEDLRNEFDNMMSVFRDHVNNYLL